MASPLRPALLTASSRMLLKVVEPPIGDAEAIVPIDEEQDSERQPTAKAPETSSGNVHGGKSPR